MPQLLHPQRNNPLLVPIGYEAGWAPELVWTLAREKIPAPAMN